MFGGVARLGGNSIAASKPISRRIRPFEALGVSDEDLANAIVAAPGTPPLRRGLRIREQAGPVNQQQWLAIHAQVTRIAQVARDVGDEGDVVLRDCATARSARRRPGRPSVRDQFSLAQHRQNGKVMERSLQPLFQRRFEQRLAGEPVVVEAERADAVFLARAAPGRASPADCAGRSSPVASGRRGCAWPSNCGSARVTLVHSVKPGPTTHRSRGSGGTAAGRTRPALRAVARATVRSSFDDSRARAILRACVRVAKRRRPRDCPRGPRRNTCGKLFEEPLPQPVAHVLAHRHQRGRPRAVPWKSASCSRHSSCASSPGQRFW